MIEKYAGIELIKKTITLNNIGHFSLQKLGKIYKDLNITVHNDDDTSIETQWFGIYFGNEVLTPSGDSSLRHLLGKTFDIIYTREPFSARGYHYTVLAIISDEDYTISEYLPPSSDMYLTGLIENSKGSSLKILGYSISFLAVIYALLVVAINIEPQFRHYSGDIFIITAIITFFITIFSLIGSKSTRVSNLRKLISLDNVQKMAEKSKFYDTERYSKTAQNKKIISQKSIM